MSENMVNEVVGYRFSPTGEELINHYLKNKIKGKTWLVEEAISEISICSFEPNSLPGLAKIKSNDLVWYFFAPKEYTSAKNKVTKRTTRSGFWKSTGVDRKIKDKRGHEIGIKKTLVYHLGKVPNAIGTSWVIHEYHITCLPVDQRSYVICKVMYNGDEGDISYGNNSSEPSHSLLSESSALRAINTLPQPGQETYNGLSMDDLSAPMNIPEDFFSLSDGFNPDMFFNYNADVHQQNPCDDFCDGLLNDNGGAFEDVIPDQEFRMQENRNDYRPKKSLSGVIVGFSSDSDSDSDAESIIATSYQEISSPGDSDGSSNRHFPSFTSTDSCKDLQPSTEPSINRKTPESQLTQRTVPSKQEVKQGTSRAVNAPMDKESSMVKTEEKGLFVLEEAMERNVKKPQYIYLVNMIIGFILMLSLIGNIISVY